MSEDMMVEKEKAERYLGHIDGREWLRRAVLDLIAHREIVASKDKEARPLVPIYQELAEKVRAL